MLCFGGISTKTCNMMPLVDRVCNDLNVTDSVSSLGYYDQQKQHLTRFGCSRIPVLAPLNISRFLTAISDEHFTCLSCCQVDTKRLA